jgi:hypothetical protein
MGLWTIVDKMNATPPLAINAFGIFRQNFPNSFCAVSLAIKLELEADGLKVVKRQGAGAVQDAGANNCGFRDARSVLECGSPLPLLWTREFLLHFPP